MSNVVSIERPMDMAPAAMTPLTPMAMISHAISQGADLSMVQQLMDLRDREDAKQSRRAFDAAMAAAKAEIPIIQKNRVVDFTSSKGRTHYRHEDLAEIARTVNPILARHGLSYRFRSSVEGSMVTVTCVVSHRDGYFEENTLSAGRDDSGNKNSIQAVGSALTYLQRMTLKASLGLAASDDDDGHATSQPCPTTITDAQIARLRALLAEAEADEARFCARGKVAALSEIRSDDFDNAVNLLQSRIADRQKNGGQS